MARGTLLQGRTLKGAGSPLLPNSVVTDISASPKGIDSTGVGDGQSPFYNAASGKWKPGNVVVSLSANNTFTGNQTYQGQLIVNHGVTQAPVTTSTFIEIDGNMTNPDAAVRPSAQHVHYYAAPAVAPLVSTDFHGIDLEVSAEAGSNINNFGRIYSIEANAKNASTVQMDELCAMYGLIGVGYGGVGGGIGTGGGGTAGWAAGYQSSMNMKNGAVVLNYNAFRIRAPSDSGGGGTITNAYGLYIPTWVSSGITYTNPPFAVFVDTGGGTIRTNENILIQNNNAAATVTQVGLTVNNDSTKTDYAVKFTNSGTAGCLLATNQAASTNYVAQFINSGSGGAVEISNSSASAHSALNIDNNAAHNGISVNQAGGAQGIIVTQTGAQSALNLSSNVVGAAGFYSMQITAYDFGATIVTNQDSGITLNVAKNQTGAGTVVKVINKGTGLSLDIQTASASVFAVTAAGLPKWVVAGNVQTTVGAAGGASALPASPTKYLKVVGDDGVTYVVPAFAAA